MMIGIGLSMIILSCCAYYFSENSMGVARDLAVRNRALNDILELPLFQWGERIIAVLCLLELLRKAKTTTVTSLLGIAFSIAWIWMSNGEHGLALAAPWMHLSLIILSLGCVLTTIRLQTKQQ